MRVESAVVASTIAEYASAAKRLEDAGYDAVMVPEAGHDPFLPLMTIAEHTSTLKFGTAVAIAFPRSPFVTAQIAWTSSDFPAGASSSASAPRSKATTSAVTPHPGTRPRAPASASTCSA